MKIRKILVSQPKPGGEKSPYFDIAEKYGVQIDFHSFIKVEAVSAKDFRTQKINILDHSAIIFSSRTGIDHFFRLCKELRVNVPESMKYFCISEQVAVYLQHYIHYRKRKVFFHQTGKLPELITLIKKHPNEKYLLACTDVHNEDIITMLNSVKAKFNKGVMYRTVSNDFEEGFVLNYDVLVFFTPMGIQSLKKNFPNFEQGEVQIATLGKSTAQAVVDAGLRLDLEVPQPQFTSITAALEWHIKENHKIYNKK